ncbi:MAG TPA: ATP-binding protein [Thermoanaerobaculia bacterium]|nr:ATP-binding protein [Thermoanaerobaculia bacterium]
MNLKVTVTTLLALLLAAALVFELFARPLSGAWFTFGVHPDVMAQLEQSLADQKRLARLDPAAAAAYRRRFAAAKSLLDRLRILRYNRAEVVGRYHAALLAVFGALAGIGGATFLVRQLRQQARLDRLQGALAELSAGREDVEIGDHRRDLIGRIAAMIERTSRAVTRDRRRLASLENLAAWQEAARRHAHEMRTPLTAARLELARLRRLLPGAVDDRCAEEAGQPESCLLLVESVGQELERLGKFTQAFTSFARLPQPRLAPHDLAALAAEFAATFAAAWPNLKLVWRPLPAAVPCRAAIDRELLRQVLVNLCDNSSLALGGDAAGEMVFSLAGSERWLCLDAADSGPGVPPEIRGRLFAPYATTRPAGEGMGLGLAISRKILLDHGGDLELLVSSPAGATFRLLLPRLLEPATQALVTAPRDTPPLDAAERSPRVGAEGGS